MEWRSIVDAGRRVAIEVLQSEKPDTKRKTMFFVVRFLEAVEKAACNNFPDLHRLVSAR
jgi:hypothetical protein